MKGFIRLFPLNWVIFPREEINLHIFEPRYRQLIAECEETGEPFGVPFFKEGIRPIGTLLRLKEVKKRFPDGRADIVAIGLEPFELLKFSNQVEGKLYPGGTVKTSTVTYNYEEADATHLLELMETFFGTIGLRPEMQNPMRDNLSFLFGHKLGLSQEKEVELLLIQDESERQHYLIDHLEQLNVTLKDVEETRSRIKLNGHFKHFDPLDF